MFRFTIRDVLWLTAFVAMGVGWWLDHRELQTECSRAEGECNGRCNPIMDYADRLRGALSEAKVLREIRDEQLIKVMVNQGRQEDEMRQLLADDGIDWTILDERKPYSWH